MASGAMLALFILLQSVVLSNRGKKAENAGKMKLKKE